MDTSARPFRLPHNLSLDQQVAFSLQVIGKYRQEILPLRKKITLCQQYHDPLIEQLKAWREKYHKAEQERERLKKENEKLKKKIEKLSKTNNRYQVALFDHGNFTHPDKRDKKTKGGQKGHADTNREVHEDYSSYKRERLFGKTCGNCGGTLSRVKAIRQKIFIDIVINPEVKKMIFESERQWCRSCHLEVSVRDIRTLPFTEYGINTFMIVMNLRFKAHASFSAIKTILHVSNGLTLSTSDVSNILSQASGFLGKRYEDLKRAVRKGDIMYNDETGWLIHGQKAWMWIMANEEVTVYFAAESRGKGIAEELYGNSKAAAMTDGLASYTNVIPKERHLYCWSHVLRFAFEETIRSKKTSVVVFLREELVRVYHIKETHPEYSKEQLEAVLRHEFDKLLSLSSREESFTNIQRRIRDQKEGLIRALLVTPDGTNNLAERELRNMAIKRSISHGSDTYKGMETSAIIGSVLQTLHRNKKLPFFPTLQSYITEGIREKHNQYVHTPYHDL